MRLSSAQFKLIMLNQAETPPFDWLMSFPTVRIRLAISQQISLHFDDYILDLTVTWFSVG